MENKYTDRVKELRKELGVTLALRSETKTDGPPVKVNTRFPEFEGLKSVTQREVDLFESFKDRDVSVVMASRNAAARRSIPHLQERWCEEVMDEDAVHEISFQSGGFFHRMMHGMLQNFLKNAADPRFHDFSHGRFEFCEGNGNGIDRSYVGTRVSCGQTGLRAMECKVQS